MLTLEQNSINKLDIVCKDLLTIDDPIYLWRFVNKIEQDEYLIELENQTPLNLRFDQFILNLPDTLNLSPGEYYWFVYQSESPGDENYSTMPLLSSGDLRIIVNFSLNKSYEPAAGKNHEYQG